MVDKDEVKESIINISGRIFSRFGFRKTTVDEIAYASRKGKSSIYYYFESKEEIFKAVVEKEAGLMKAEIMKSVGAAETSGQKLKAHVVTRMQSMEKLANFYSALKDDYLSHLDFIEKIRKDFDQDEISMMEEILVQGCLNNEFEIQDTHLTAVGIVTALKGLEIPLFWDGEEKNTGSRIDHLVHVLFHGILKR